MCKFKKVDSKVILLTPQELSFINNCIKNYSKYFQDDFAFIPKNIFEIPKILPNNFWLILNFYNKPMGFVYLDNFIGKETRLYSAELTTCFAKCAWGDFTKYSAKIFLKKCFDDFGLEKIKAQVYPDNFRVKNLLKICGFTHESTLQKETLRNGKPQNIEVYGLYRNYYYKK